MGNSQFVTDRFPALQGTPPTSNLRLNFIDNLDGTCTAYVEDRTNTDAVSTAAAVPASGLKIVGTASGGVTGTGTTGTLTKWTNGPGSVIGDSLLSETAGLITDSGNFRLPLNTTFPPTAMGLQFGASAGLDISDLTVAVGHAYFRFQVDMPGDTPINPSLVFDYDAAGGAPGKSFSVVSAVVGEYARLVLQISTGSVWLTTLASGVLRLSNAGATNFDRLVFGAATALFPALKRSGTALQLRLGDDSGFGPFDAGTFRVNGSTSGVITIQGAAAAGTWTLTLPIDDGTPGQFLQTDGNGVTSWQTAGSVSGTGTTNTLPKFTDGASGVLGDSQLTDDGSIVTINSGVTGHTTLIQGADADDDVVSIRAGGDPAVLIQTNNKPIEIDVSLLRFNGATASFPALKRAATALQVRLADDSDFASITASAYSVGATAGVDGTFTTVDLKTVTVTKGIITSIV